MSVKSLYYYAIEAVWAYTYMYMYSLCICLFVLYGCGVLGVVCWVWCVGCGVLVLGFLSSLPLRLPYRYVVCYTHVHVYSLLMRANKLETAAVQGSLACLAPP